MTNEERLDKLGWECSLQQYINGEQSPTKAYIAGYKQAQKDCALKPDDIQKIVMLLLEYSYSHSHISNEERNEFVAKKFNESKSLNNE